MEEIKCYRFIKADMTSQNGSASWNVDEWNRVDNEIVCCVNGLHAALTPLASLRNVYGDWWFVAEARGEVVRQGNQLAASEMRLIREIPMATLQRFALWCSRDCLKYYADCAPNDASVRACVLAAGRYLDGEIDTKELAKAREAVTASAATGAAGRAAASAIATALSILAPNSAAWANAAVSAAYAAHLTADAVAASSALVSAQYRIHNVESAAQVATLADSAALAAHRAASAAAMAHAAAVNAARNLAPLDTASDAYYSSFAAFTALEPDAYCESQNAKLEELISAAFK